MSKKKILTAFEVGGWGHHKGQDYERRYKTQTMKFLEKI